MVWSCQARCTLQSLPVPGETGQPAELSRPGSYLQAHPWTMWHCDPTLPLHCLVYTCLTLHYHTPGHSRMKVDSQNFRHLWPLILSLTLTHHNGCLALYSPCAFVFRNLSFCVGPYMLQAETDRRQCGKCFSLSLSPPPLQWKHHGILTCCSTTSPENSL